MIVYFSKESRYRNMGLRPSRRRIDPPYLLFGAIALVLVCCICGGAILVSELFGAPQPPKASGSARTPTAAAKAGGPSAAPGKSASDGNLEVVVTGLERPLRVEGGPKIPPNYEFILVTVRVRNVKTSGAAVKLNPADFKVTGDGGLSYDANPKNVTIDNLMTTQDSVDPGNALERELIFLIANDDSGLKLNWKTPSAVRVLLLEQQ